MRKTAAAIAPLLLSLFVLACPKPQTYQLTLTPEELRIIRSLEPGQTAVKSFTFTLDPNLVEDCCIEGDCCCTCQCDPLPCVCTCTDEIIVRGGGADISQSPARSPLVLQAAAPSTPASACAQVRR